MKGGGVDDRSLKAILICPDSTLYSQFSHASQGLSSIEVALHLDQYPPGSVLRDTLRQTGVELVLIDVSSDLAKGLDTTATTLESTPEAAVIALHSRNDPDAILQCLRNGCSELRRTMDGRVGDRVPGTGLLHHASDRKD